MRGWVVALGLLVPLGAWAQFPPGEAGELVLAYTWERTDLAFPGGGEFPTRSIQVWESGFVERTVFSGGSPILGEISTERSTRVVSVEEVQRLKTDLIELGIFKLDGQVRPVCFVCFGILRPQPQRVTFISRLPKHVIELVRRYPHLYKRFGVYLRPKEASFAASPAREVRPSQEAFFVLNRINQFERETFPEQTDVRH